MPSPPGCEVNLRTKAIRFFGCEDDKAKINAVEKHLAEVTRQLKARSGLTNKERRALNREANILRRWLEPKASLKMDRRVLKSIRNLGLSITPNRRWKPSKRRGREARRWNREQNLQRRPDYDPCVITTDELECIRRLRT
jgi:hypothetical protein